MNNSGTAAAIRKIKLRRILYISLAVPVLVVLTGYSLTIGSANISLMQGLKAAFSPLFPHSFQVSERVFKIIWVLRMPRVLIAVLAGATLGMTGCIVQAVIQNPLASPYTLGVSASAGFGAALGLILGVGFFDGMLAVTVNAFLFSLIPAAVVLFVSVRSDLGRNTIILSGVAISYIFSALNTLLQFIAEDDALRLAVFWLVGDLTRASMAQVPWLLTTSVLFFIISMFMVKDIKIMKMGDEDAKGMGVNSGRVKTIALICSCFGAASVICFTGSIGFIGLLAPHISRLVIGDDEYYLVPASALTGACLLVSADILSRIVWQPVLLPVGAVTALTGGPVLVYMLLRRRKDSYAV